MSMPLVTVIIPVFNQEQFLGECMRSILGQSYRNLEIIVVDDASTDESGNVVNALQDDRIILTRNKTNIGLAATVNEAIRRSRGEFIARMDADDIAVPNRVEMQVAFMQSHSEVSISGGAMQSFGHSNFLHRFPMTHEACKAQLLFNVCFGHPTVMFRKSMFDGRDTWYNEELRQYSEEYELWCRLVDRFTFANVPNVLLRYRTFAPGLKSTADEKRVANSRLIRKKFITTQFGEVMQADHDAHDTMANLTEAVNVEELQRWLHWLSRMGAMNSVSQRFQTKALELELDKRRFEICYWNTQLGMNAWRAWNTNTSKSYVPTTNQRLKFIAKALAGKR